MVAKGFTLLEVLVAVALTALIGVGATQLLSGIIDARQATEIRSEQLASLQRFDLTVSRDIEQFIARNIRNEFGESSPALELNGRDYLIEFTRTGWRNIPQATTPRVELQRVAYKLESIHSEACKVARVRLESWGVAADKGECLVRYFWPVLDRGNRSEPIAQMLLEQVDALDIEVLSSRFSEGIETQQADSTHYTDDQWHTNWPSINYGESATNKVLRAVRWRLRMPDFGEIERLWLIAGGHADE